MEAKKRSRRSAKAAGRSLEVALVEALNLHNLQATRLGRQGAHDKGDVTALRVPDHVFEAKNCRTLALTTWWQEAVRERENAQASYGWIVHKRHGVADPSEQWATTTTGQLAKLLFEIATLRETVSRLQQATQENHPCDAPGNDLTHTPG
ncbi:MAG: hypothetical protein ACYCWN_09780 [Ferrimicrobium sp.]|uniref:Uncharacterized protein n=1 Tax=Ferrimicrobium acidiphilum TaxID=121039 RepID=A0ABV3Y6D8_9ACTN|nr:hypothetical protein [Ferrimicrobium sp.]